MLVTLAMSGLLGNKAYGQLPMTRSVFSAAYTPISVLGGATLSTITGDDGTQTLIPIGFTFNYLGTNYTTIDGCSNGWISFGAAAANNWTNSGLFTTTTPNLTLAPWWDDLNTGTGNVLYQLQGTPGSQTFTFQWNDIASYNGSVRTINFQCILYEGTNVIEFRYGTVGAGAFTTSESASIGIEGATGGAGNFLDAVSGSAFINQSYMTTHKWPAAHIRFTPGAPTAIAGGTYTVGLAGTYPNISEAFANVNHRGITGPITLSLIDATYDTTLAGGRNTFPLMMGPVAGNSAVNTITVQPAAGTSTLSYRGVSAGNGGNIGSATALGTTNEPILAFVGTDFVTVRNLNLTSVGSSVSNLVDRGLLVANASATDGSQNGLYENLTVSLLRTNTSSIGIQQLVATAATSAAGANSTNNYRNLSISNSYSGMYLLGTAAFPDLACQIGNSSPTAFNTIGGATAFDLGGGNAATQCYGIRIASQSGAKVFNNSIRNVSAQAVTDGILCELGQGTNEIYMNKITAVRNNSTTSTSNACGIRANLATTGTHSLRVYNNFASDVSSAYTGAATATRIVKGIFVQSAGGGVATLGINVDANNVRIDGTLFPNASNSCFEIGTASGPVMNVRNNVFANYTGAQTGVATHNAWFSTSATAVGNTGSVSNYNDLYVANATNGFTGTGAATTYATLANWQAAMVGQDANSVATDPTFISVSDLHVTGSGVNNVGNLTGSAWVTVDIDNAARSVGTPDIGADEFTPSTIDMQAIALNTPLTTGCYSATEAVNVQIKNNAPIAIDFSLNPTTVTVNVTGAITTTLTVTVNSGTLASGATQAVAMGTVNMSTLGTYTFNGNTTVTGDGVPVNDAFTTVNITISAGTATGSVNTLCVGGSVTLSLAGHNGTIQWQGSTDGGTSWTNETGPGNTATPYTTSPTDTTLYRALICGTFTSTTFNVLANPLVTPTVVADSVCGQGIVNLSAAGAPTINWYTVPSGGAPVATGATYSPFINATTTYYAEAVNGGSITAVGLPNNLAGGAQQTSTNYNIFDVLSNCTLVGVYVYPGAAGTAVLELRNSAGVLLQTASLTVGAADVNNRTYFPLGFNLTPGTGFRLAQGTPSVSMFRNASGVAYPYTLPGVISITGSAAGATFWYFGYDWQILTGCPGPRVPVTGTVTVAPTVSIASSATTSCSGDPVELIASSTNPTYNYVWTPATGLNTTTNDTVISTPALSTTYIVNGSDTASGCVSADTVVVLFALKPAVTATATPDTICAGDSLSLTSVAADIIAQIGNGTLANTSTSYPAPFGNFYWGSRHQMLILASELQAQGLSAGNLTSLAFDVTSLNFAVPHQNFEIKLAHTNATAVTAFLTPVQTSVYTNASLLPSIGIVPMVFSTPFNWDGVSNLLVETCHNNSAFNDNVSVNQTVTPFTSTVYFRADAAGVCGNATVTASIAQRPNMYFTGSKSYGYAWTPSTNLASPTAANSMATTMASGDFIVMYTDSSTGCVGMDTTSVVANPLPLVNIGNDGFFCGTTTTLDAGNAGATYLWNTLDSTQTLVINTSGSYDVQVTDSIGCTGTDSIAITFTPNPIISLGADTSFCAGGSVVLDAGLTPATYVWTTGPTTQTITVNASGTYGVAVTDTFGCGGSDSIDVVVNALPTVALTLGVDSLCSTQTSAITLNGGSPAGGTFSGPGVAGNNFTPSVAGVGTHTITYLVTDGNGCSNTDTDVIVVYVCVGVADAMNSFPLGLYPNPNTGRFTFTVPMDVTGDVNYEVADARGVVVVRETTNQPSGIYKQEVSLADFATGIYTLRVTVDGKTAQKRFVVQR